MKKLMILIIAGGFTSHAFAGNLNLICEGNVGSVQVSVENIDDMNASIDVTHESPHGNVTRMMNSHMSNREAQKAIKNGAIAAIVSKSNLQKKFGDLYEEASMVSLTLDKATKKWTVQVSMNNSVIQSVCSTTK